MVPYFRPPTLRTLGAPSSYKLVSLLPIGYPVEQPHKPKRSLHEVLYWEVFCASTPDQARQPPLGYCFLRFARWAPCC